MRKRARAWLARWRAIRRLRDLGIVYPRITYDEARRAGIPLSLACAVLEQETGGGRNVFGHDPTIFAGAGRVTRRKYLEYRRMRGPSGEGGMQGVGPMQLTWWRYQDMADQLGGCWRPRWNIRVGFKILSENLRKHDLRDTLRVYNGSYRYADEVMIRKSRWERKLSREGISDT